MKLSVSPPSFSAMFRSASASAWATVTTLTCFRLASSITKYDPPQEDRTAAKKILASRKTDCTLYFRKAKSRSSRLRVLSSSRSLRLNSFRRAWEYFSMPHLRSGSNRRSMS